MVKKKVGWLKGSKNSLSKSQGDKKIIFLLLVKMIR